MSGTLIRVELPAHLRILAKVDGPVHVQFGPDDATPPSLAAVLDRLESMFPVLRGAIRDHDTKKRRAFLRFFACGKDLTHDPPESPLPDAVVRGEEPLHIIGAIAGG